MILHKTIYYNTYSIYNVYNTCNIYIDIDRYRQNEIYIDVLGLKIMLYT